MPFFYLECHYGDDNDNHIRDYVIEAPSRDILWDYLESNSKEECGIDSEMGYSDSTQLSCTWFDPDDDTNPDGKECEGTQRIYHRDFYLISNHDTEQEANRNRRPHHGQSALIRVDAEGKEVADGP